MAFIILFILLTMLEDAIIGWFNAEAWENRNMIAEYSLSIGLPLIAAGFSVYGVYSLITRGKHTPIADDAENDTPFSITSYEQSPYESATQWSNKYSWIRLKVENNTKSHIPKCYGKLISCDILFEDGSSYIGEAGERMEGWPDIGSLLYWDKQLTQTEITIPGNKSPVYLHILRHEAKDAGFFIPTPETRENVSRNEWEFRKPLGVGLYEFIVEIGSLDASFKQTKVRFLLNANQTILTPISLEDITNEEEPKLLWERAG